MHINKIDNTNFQAGKVSLVHVKPGTFNNLRELKNLAKEKDVDISISKTFDRKYLPNYDIYTIFITKLMEKGLKSRKIKLLKSSGIIVHPKKGNKETLSENIYYEALETTNKISKPTNKI